MSNRVVEGTRSDFDHAAHPEAHPENGCRPEDQARSCAVSGERIVGQPVPGETG
ncbi:hypothetical protein [Roseovarius salis]|uniref:hypothetical protein n=1 Tax=Roseovarius salis TaxID=3376063 RepID=UPI0037C569E4